MKETNRLENYIEKQNQSFDSHQRVKKWSLLILVIILLGVISFLGYRYYDHEKVSSFINNFNTDSPSSVQQDSINHSTNKNKNLESDLDTENDVIIESSSHPSPSLYIKGDFVVGKPLRFMLKYQDDITEHFIDFGDGKNVNIKRMIHHTYKRDGDFEISFQPHGSNKIIKETIHIKRKEIQANSQFATLLSAKELKQKNKAKVNLKVHQRAKFPGGTTALIAYLQTHLKNLSGFNGRILLSFNVKKNGDLSQLKIIEGIHNQLDKDILSVFDKMPKWIPAIKNGKKIQTEYRIPLYFEKET